MANEPNFYKLLQVDRRASQEIIEAAYHRLARKYHPDVNKSADAALMMQKLNNAYRVLSDPVKRADYDRRIFKRSERPRKEEVKTEQQKTAPEPIACQNCGRIDETLRATAFQYVISIVIFSFKRGGGAGILCGNCRRTRAIAYTALSLLLGIWGVPWGILWALEAIIVNLQGGRQPSELNGSLLRSLGAYLWSIGKRAEGYEALEASLRFEKNLEVKEFLGRNVEARQKPHAVPTKKEAQWDRSALVPIGVLALFILLLLIPNLSAQLPGRPFDESSAGPSAFRTPTPYVAAPYVTTPYVTAPYAACPQVTPSGTPFPPFSVEDIANTMFPCLSQGGGDLFSVENIEKTMRGYVPSPPPLPCGDLPPGTAGLLYINHFPGEATVTIVVHEYHVPGNSRMVIPIPAGKPFTIDAFIPGVGRYRPTLGPYTWEAGECHQLEPHN